MPRSEDEEGKPWFIVLTVLSKLTWMRKRVEEGEILTCPECEAELEVVQIHPVRLNVISEGDEDEDDDDEDDDDDRR